MVKAKTKEEDEIVPLTPSQTFNVIARAKFSLTYKGIVDHGTYRDRNQAEKHANILRQQGYEGVDIIERTT